MARDNTLVETVSGQLGGMKTGSVVSERIRGRWVNFATQASHAACPASRCGLPYQEPDRTSLLIGRQDAVVCDIDSDIRATWGAEVLNFR